MTASIALTQYQIKTDSYALRIGDELVDLPSDLTDKIGSAIAKVSEFNTEHAMIAREIWDGTVICDPDIVEVGYE